MLSWVCSRFCWISLTSVICPVVLRVCVDEALFKLTFAFDSSVFHVLEILRHVFHLISEARQVWVVLLFSFNHL